VSSLRLFLLGTPRLERDGVPLKLYPRKNVALVAYLAVAGLGPGADRPGGVRFTREALVTLLWPELEPGRGRAGLRRNLSLLRKTLDRAWLLADRETVGVDPRAGMWLDVEQFLRLLRAWQGHGHPQGDPCPRCLSALAEAVALYRGDFMAGFSLRDSPGFDEWQFFQTEGLRQELASALECLVRGHSARGEYEPAIPYARRWLALDPLHEPAHRHLMRLYAWSDQYAAALRQYGECQRLLEAELGVPPEQETRQLGRAIREKRLPPPPGADLSLPGALTGATPQDRHRLDAEIGPAATDVPYRAQDLLLKRIGRSRLVGRGRELREASALWDRALVGQGGVLLISGEPGIGKTRLVRELAEQARASGGQALVAGCYAEGGVPYAPFARILRRVLEPGSDGGLDLPEFVLADLITLAPALRLRYPDVGPGPALDDPRLEAHRRFDNLAIFFRALSGRTPLLLAVEDVHWADSGTLSLLRHLSRHTGRGRMMIVATYRDVEPEDAQRLHEMLLDLRRERLATHLSLSRLDRDQTGEMLAALFASEISPGFLEGVWHETEGNPFFVEEVVRALVEGGKLTFQEGRWQQPGMDELGIPQSIRVAIQSRLRVLPASVQETLCLAAVLGREFDLETLLYANASYSGLQQGRGEAALLEALEAAERARLIEGVSEEDGGTFAFVHGLIAATLVQGLRMAQRRRLHLCAAAAVEARHPDDLEALAHHYNQGGQAEKAVTYLLQAGDRARALYAHQEAIDDYRRALAYLQKAGDRVRAARTMMKLGLTYQNAFDYRAARQAYQEAFVLWQEMAEVDSTAALLPAPHPLRVTAIEPATLNRSLVTDTPSAMAVCQLFSGLVEVGPDMAVVPDVAHSWEMVDGGRRYVFHLREDVAWSDGVPVTAGDFEYAWKEILDPGSGLHWASYLYDIQGARAYHRGQLADLDEIGVHALDDHTLVVDLERPTSYFPHLLTTMDAFPVPRHAIQVHGPAWAEPANMVSNGPFRLVAWERGEGMVLERNPTYHGRFVGNLRRVECSFLSGQAARFVQMYEENRLDICSDLPPADMNRARLRHAGEYVAGPRLQTGFIGLDVARPPFDDRRVRRALALATDREALAHVALGGYAFPATGGLVPPGMPGHAPAIGLPYDPDAARALLAEAGYPGGRGFPAIEGLARDDPGHDLLCAHVEAQWRETLGIAVAWQQIAWGKFYERRVEATPHLWLVGWVADYPDPDDFLRVQWWFAPGWQHGAYDRLVEDARRVPDQAERMAMYRQAEGILVEEVPILPLTYGRFHVLVKPWVKGYRTSPMPWWFWKDVILEAH
jgi:oligopeptide transport system substrate-binding protein